MEGDPDVPENAKETDNLVPAESGQGDLEMTTLLSEMPGHSAPSHEEVESRPSEARPHPHPYHMKNKYTFRSDSVYSDVVPISAASHSHNSNNKVSEPREKFGSLSSLKAKESKWMTLKKKLGKLNSNSNSLSSTSSEKPRVEEKDKVKPLAKSVVEKRSLFQRAKTLSILPVHKTSRDKESSLSPPRRVIEPKELFNVGGEMNLIPLELLIDVNSMGLRK